MSSLCANCHQRSGTIKVSDSELICPPCADQLMGKVETKLARDAFLWTISIWIIVGIVALLILFWR